MSKSNKKKYTFTLYGININKINITYGITPPIVCEEIDEKNQIKNTTRLVELNNKGTPDIISFLDESKRLHRCQISMIDFQSKMDINLLRYHCYWCRHPFDTQPIGCPIRYVSSQAEKKYHSQISQDVYTIKESITTNKRNILTENEQMCIKIGEYYETDGVFCSFNCCQAWINDNKHNRLYDKSNNLLSKMYNTMMNTKNVVIIPAPHWRILEQYGGHVNIMSFRDGFNKVDYKYHGITKKLPNFLSLGTLYEEHIRF